MTAITGPFRGTLLIRPRSIAAGLVCAAALLGIYVGIVGFAQGIEHAFELLAIDAPFVGLITAGFGIQIALFAELRTVDRAHRAPGAITAASTGTSAAAMLACCAHHVVDLLPLVGLSAAAVFLNAYKTPLLLVGIGMNLIGIVVIARQLQKARRACAIVDGATPEADVTPNGAVAP